MLAAHVRRVLGAGEVRTGRLCPHCGAETHGRPWVRHGNRRVEVSLARSGAHLLTAVSTAGALGVDVESVAGVARAWEPGLVLAPGERAETDRARARIWVRKEAVVKAYGVGLVQPLVDLRLTEFAEVLSDVPAPEGFVAALAQIRAAAAGRWRTPTS